VLAVLAGCGVPTHGGHAHVATQVDQLTGRSLGPASGSDKPILPDGVSLEDGLTQDEAVAIGLWNNAAFREVLAELGFSRAELIHAGLLSNPVLSVLFPLGPKQLEFAAKLPLEVLWLRPKRIAAAKLDADQVAERLVQSGLDLIRDVRVAWVDALLASKRVRLAEEGVRLADRIASLAEARLQAGDVSEIEVTNTNLAALLARGEARRIACDLELAQQRLISLIGLGFFDVALTLDDSSAATAAAFSVDVGRLMENGLTARPDLRAAELAIEGARERVRLARRDFLALSGGVDANEDGSEGFEIGPAMEVGIPMFNWNQDGVARARAELNRSLLSYVTLRDRIALEVKQAHARLRAAEEQAEIWSHRAVPEIEEAVRRAEKAYVAGDVSVLLLLQMSEQLLEVRTRQIEAVAEVSRARAELERSVGCRLESSLARTEPPP